jgi:hypothetical protein
MAGEEEAGEKKSLLLEPFVTLAEFFFGGTILDVGGKRRRQLGEGLHC